MSSASARMAYAIDFGTTNSLLAAAGPDGVVPPVALEPEARDPTILRSVLYFASAERCVVGAAAVAQYVEDGMQGRLLRSVKKHLGSRHFSGTTIDGRPLTVEQLVAIMLREMRLRADRALGVEVRRAVLGRPARFSSDDDDDRLAEARLARAAELAGFEEVRFVPEPVAAARDFRRASRGARTVLVADLGGGTSDFTVMRVHDGAYDPSDVLAVGGVALAGDAYDASLMRSKIAVHFGADVTYRVPTGSNEMRMPPALIERLCSPADLSILRREDVRAWLTNIRAWSLGAHDREKIDRLFTLVDDALGFAVFEAIEETKRTLSREPRAEFRFRYPTVDLDDVVTRDELEHASARVTAGILHALDETLARAGVGAADIGAVCATGGSARLPLIARALRERFPHARIDEFRTFHSVVSGLAEHAVALARDAA